MLELAYSSQFKKDFKKVAKRPIPDVLETGHVISALQHENSLAEKYVDHRLTGNWKGFRDCHIKPDLILIYRIEKFSLQLARIGTHSELFK